MARRCGGAELLVRRLPALGHDQFADHEGFDLAFAGGAQLVLDVNQRGFEALDAHRTFLQGALHAGAEFFFVERLAAAVSFDQAR